VLNVITLQDHFPSPFSLGSKIFVWALQLVYQLFITNVEPKEEEVRKVMEMAEEAIRAQERDPHTAFANRVRELNYGNSYFFRVSLNFVFLFVGFSAWIIDLIFFFVQPIKISDLKRVDPFKACDYFSKCFKDPSTFTVVIVGKIDPPIACPLILQYLVSGNLLNLLHF